MNDKTSIKQALGRIGNIELKGLMKKVAVLKRPVVDSAKDVVGFNYLLHEAEGTCYAYYAANPPLSGMTEPQPTTCPIGIETFGEYKIDYKNAIDVFHSGNWGSSFSSLTLSKPLTHPEALEPYWYFVSNLGVQVMIGADTGKVYYPR